ncbi:MAG: hypothetical protein AB1894_16955 [Chloroflexota bacterium]
MDQNRRTEALKALALAPLRFTYPFLARLFTLLGGVLLLAGGIMSALSTLVSPAIPFWVPLLFLLLGIPVLLAWYALCPQIFLDAEGLSRRLFGRTTRIRYEDITRIEEKAASQRLVIWGTDGKIMVEKQLNRYEDFYRLLAQLASIKPGAELPSTLPLEIKAPARQRALYLGVSAFGVFLLLLTVRDGFPLEGLLASLAFILGGAAMALFAAPLRYILDVRQLIVITLLRRKSFDWSDLQAVRYESALDLNTFTRAVTLKLVFRTGKVVFDPGAINYPLEQLEAFILKHFGDYIPKHV